MHTMADSCRLIPLARGPTRGRTAREPGSTKARLGRSASGMILEGLDQPAPMLGLKRIVCKKGT